MDNSRTLRSSLDCSDTTLTAEESQASRQTTHLTNLSLASSTTRPPSMTLSSSPSTVRRVVGPHQSPHSTESSMIIQSVPQRRVTMALLEQLMTTSKEQRCGEQSKRVTSWDAIDDTPVLPPTLAPLGHEGTAAQEQPAVQSPNCPGGRLRSGASAALSPTCSSEEKQESGAVTVGHQHCWQHPRLEEAENSILPAARAAHSCDTVDSTKLYVFGGWNGKKAMNDVYALDTQKLVWSFVRTKGVPPERNNHATASVGHRLYVHGGHDGTKWLNDLYVLDTESGTWTEIVIHGHCPSARACHTLSRVNDKLYMFGGYDGSRCFNDIDILDLDTMTWIQPKTNGRQPLPRNAHTMTVVDTKLFLFGGHSGNRHLTDLHIFDTTTMRWSQPIVHGAPPPGLRGHTANLIGDRIFFFGGYDGKGRSNNLYILESVKLKWIHPQGVEGAPCGRQRHSACLVGAKRLFIFGGFDGSKWLRDLNILDVGRLTEDELSDSAIRNLTQNLKKMIGDPEFADITLVVEGKEIPAHRNILAAQCPYFKSMFSNHMREARESRVVVPQWTYSAFMAMLEYLYTGRMSESNPHVVCDVLGLADFYSLDGLKTLCENILKHSIDHENVCHFLQNADRYQAPDLKAFCENFILRHPNYVTRTQAFDQLASSPTLMLQLTKLSLTRNCRETRGGSGGDEGSGGI